MIFEQDPIQILNGILPLYLNGLTLRALQESVASELAARMQAMQSASDNAKDLQKGLETDYNRLRAAAARARATRERGRAAATGTVASSGRQQQPQGAGAGSRPSRQGEREETSGGRQGTGRHSAYVAEL